ncbi:MAG: hypothetical protein ACRDOM_09835 [Nocardioides sp.]
MPDQSTPTRPRQVTMAGWTAMIASGLVVVAVFETIAGLNTIETREAVERFLAEPPGDGLGLGVTGALTALRVTAMVAAGCAAATAILGFHVLKGNNGARIGLSVLAVPLFLTGLVVGGFLAALVAASATVLWLAPARAWFRDGRSTTSSTQGFGERPPAPTDHPPAGPQGGGDGAGQVGVPTPRTTATLPVHRPNALVWACVLTWVLCALAAVLTVMSAWLVATSPDLIWEQLEQQNPALLERGLTQRALEVSTQVTAVAATAWGALASGFAVLAYRRVPWGRVALLVSAALAGVVCLVASLGSFVLVLPAAGCAVTFSLLVRPEVRAWFTRRGAMDS